MARHECQIWELMKKMLLMCAVSISLFGCASSGPIATGTDTYMLAKTSAGGVFVSGASVKADLLIEANDFCSKRGKTMSLIDSSAKNAIPFARMPSSEINFKCV